MSLRFHWIELYVSYFGVMMVMMVMMNDVDDDYSILK